MSTPIHSYELLVLETHLDTFGHVNNAAYLQLFEEARWQIVSDRGFGLSTIHKIKQGPTILEVTLRFKKEIKLRQKIAIKTRIVDYSGKVGLFHQWIENEQGENCCDAEFKIGLFDLTTRRLISPTPEWRGALGLN